MYYPLSQIKTNLYTNGGELSIKSNNQNYTGYYWKTSDGKYFSGKTPQDKNIQELKLTSTSTSENYSNLTSEAFEPKSQPNLNPNSSLSDEYLKLNNKLINSKLIPTSFNPKPTEEDYKFGEFTRYFCKKTNELIYIEINQDVFNKLINKDSNYLWQLYAPFKYQWIISGDAEKTYFTNRNITNLMISKYKLNALNKFLKEDYLKFWKL